MALYRQEVFQQSKERPDFTFLISLIKENKIVLDLPYMSQ